MFSKPRSEPQVQEAHLYNAVISRLQGHVSRIVRDLSNMNLPFEIPTETQILNGILHAFDEVPKDDPDKNAN